MDEFEARFLAFDFATKGGASTLDDVIKDAAKIADFIIAGRVPASLAPSVSRSSGKARPAPKRRASKGKRG